MFAFFAYRNLSRRGKRYIFIFSAMALSFAVITLITGISTGALQALQDKAARYFAGHISITGFLPGQVQEIKEPAGLIEILKKSSFPFRTIARRTIYYQGNAQLFFEGERVIQRRLIGVDEAVEAPEFANLDIIQGSFTFSDDSGNPGIVISKYAAELLHCKVGDEVTIFLSTSTGRPNSDRLVVRGIFNETSLFGFAAYMDRVYLNQLLEKRSDFCTDIALYIKPGADTDRLSQQVVTNIKNYGKASALFKTREDRDAALPKLVKQGPILVVLTQGAQLAQIQQFITAFLGISYFVLVLFLLITMTGVINTYRVLVHERKKEIGVLRALGTQKSGVIALFLWEGIELSFFATLAGFVIGYIGLFILSRINFSFIPGSGLVLERGHLRLALSVSSMLINLMLLMVTTIIAIWRPAIDGSQVQPVIAMRGGA